MRQNAERRHEAFATFARNGSAVGCSFASLLEEISQSFVVTLSNRPRKTGGGSGRSIDAPDVFHGPTKAFGQILHVRLATVFHDECFFIRSHLPDGVAHVHRHAHRARLVCDGTRNGLTNPPGGVRGKLETTLVFEAVDRTHEPHRTFFDEVLERQTAIAVFFGDGNDQTHVASHHFVLQSLFFFQMRRRLTQRLFDGRVGTGLRAHFLSRFLHFRQHRQRKMRGNKDIGHGLLVWVRRTAAFVFLPCVQSRRLARLHQLQSDFGFYAHVAYVFHQCFRQAIGEQRAHQLQQYFLPGVRGGQRGDVRFAGILHALRAFHLLFTRHQFGFAQLLQHQTNAVLQPLAPARSFFFFQQSFHEIFPSRIGLHGQQLFVGLNDDFFFGELCFFFRRHFGCFLLFLLPFFQQRHGRQRLRRCLLLRQQRLQARTRRRQCSLAGTRSFNTRDGHIFGRIEG